MTDTDDSRVVKELVVSKIWADGAKSGDETAADITLTSSAAGSIIYIGRLSATSSNNTTVILRGRANDGGTVFNSGGKQMGICDSTVPSIPNSFSIFQADSTTKGLVVPRMTTANTTVLSAAYTAVSATTMSGALVYDTTLKKLKVYNGTAWETVTSTIGA